MQRHRATSHTDIPRTALRHPLAWAIVSGLAVLFAALAYAGMGRATAATSDYTVACESPGVTGTFSFSPSPSTEPFTVRLTYHIPGAADFVPVPGASTDFPAGTTSPVAFSFSTANVPPEANTIRIDNTLNESKSISFTCPGVTSPTETPPPGATNTPPADTATSVPSTPTAVPPTATTVPSTATSVATATATSVGANTATPTTPAGGSISVAATPTRVNTVLAAQATSAAQRPTGTLALPNTGAGNGAGSRDRFILGAGLVALIALFSGGAGLVLRRRAGR